MQVTGIRLRALVPPKDSLFYAIQNSKLSLAEGDVVAISSKVVAINEGRVLPIEGTDKEKLVKSETDWYYEAPASARYRHLFTIAKGFIVGRAGIDESNGNGYYVLYPQDPFASARRIRAWLRKEYGVKTLGVIITDSSSLPLRRGSIGFALAWDGLDPLRDYRGRKDIFGREFKVEMANIVDSLAIAATLEMGEGREQIPLAVIRGVKNISYKNRSQKKEPLIVPPEDDIFAPLFWRKGWRKGGK